MMTSKAVAGVQPSDSGPIERRMIRRAAVSAVAAACTLFASTAQAGCINVGRLWTCTEVGGVVMQMYCVGPGPVRSCQELSRDEWIFIGQHEVLSQVLANANLSIAAQAASRNLAGSSQAEGEARPSVVGVLRATPEGGSSTPPPLTTGLGRLPALPPVPMPPSSAITRTVPPIAQLSPPLSVPSPAVSSGVLTPVVRDRNGTPAALVPKDVHH